MSIVVSGQGLLVPGVRGPADLARPDAAPAAPAQDWFDPVAHLGRRGWKYLSPATRYLLAAANAALGRTHGDPAAEGRRADRFGISVGTHHAIGALHVRLDEEVRRDGAAGLSPAELPGFSVNMPASQAAISLGCRAFSVTLTNPVVAGLEAVVFGADALRRGRADRVLAGATEAAPAAGGPPYDGAAALVLDVVGHGAAAGRPELLGGLSRFVPTGADGGPDPAAARAAAAQVAALAARAGGAGRIGYAFCGPPGTRLLDEAVRHALESAGTRAEPVPSTGADARFGTTSGLLRLAALLGRPEPGLTVAVSADGHLSAVVARGAD
ncbi:hypothetical protein J5Y04_37000 [Kitasatospora sp. RG8]|uniref:beta-ketoacyl synthase N-terminal-like domain-containing protein n=1 Tax=Kitasatospora sp. RG8 TaxID=2820815 RepID=UPI001ADEC1CF|nr:beta-ketoacyl synthase N-terminal-like domain-containing protein [Kitasatospora sp. RG8]MBP0455077.1 hypothetical protein [Kitasatospora sp. RG8]